MKVLDDIKLDFCDVLIQPKRSQLESRRDIVLERTFAFKYAPVPWRGVPIIASNMDGVGTISMAKSLESFQMLTALTKFINHKHVLESGCNADFSILTFEVKETVPQYQPPWICIDVPNGYTERFVRRVEYMRSVFNESIIIAGNVVTAQMTETLLLAGADIVKVGIGPGSVCTTRDMAGVGYPQLSAIAECADAAYGLGGYIVADGGCQVPGDIAKAFGAGADFVMLGGMLNGHAESELEQDNDGNLFFYGMSSKEAMIKHYGEQARHEASEGKLIKIPYRGAVAKTVEELLGGLRSACTYAGARTIQDLPKCTTFIRVNR